VVNSKISIGAAAASGTLVNQAGGAPFNSLAERPSGAIEAYRFDSPDAGQKTRYRAPDALKAALAVASSPVKNSIARLIAWLLR